MHVCMYVYSWGFFNYEVGKKKLKNQKTVTKKDTGQTQKASISMLCAFLSPQRILLVSCIKAFSKLGFKVFLNSIVH